MPNKTTQILKFYLPESPSWFLKEVCLEYMMEQLYK